MFADNNVFIEESQEEQVIDEEMNIVRQLVQQEDDEGQEIIYYTDGLYENSISDNDGSVQFVYSDDTEENVVTLEENHIEPQLKQFKIMGAQENLMIADEIYSDHTERYVSFLMY